MKVNDINPFIRFAEKLTYSGSYGNVNVFDSRIFYTLSGEAQLEINGNTLRLCEGALFYCHGGSQYSFTGSSGCELYILNFDLFQGRSNVKKALPPFKTNGKAPIYSGEETVEDAESLSSYIFIKDGYEIGEKLGEIVSEFGAKPPFFMEKCSAMLKAVIIDIFKSESFIKSPALKTIEKVCAYIRLNLDKKITNAELSYIAGYHEYHLNRIFQKHTGKTVHQYIIDARIHTAKRMLATTEMSVSDIAESAGFNSSTHLCACFKSQTGLSPAQYRKSKHPDII